MNTNDSIFVRRMLTKGISQRQALSFFDGMMPVTSVFMHGKWKGNECNTGHMMDGMLTAASWYGKYFISRNMVHPLVFSDRHGERYCVDPKKVFPLLKQRVEAPKPNLVCGCTAVLRAVKSISCCTIIVRPEAEKMPLRFSEIMTVMSSVMAMMVTTD